MKIFESNPAKVQEKDFEKQFVIPLIIAGMVFAAISIFINIGLNFGIVLDIIPYVALTTFLILYYLAKKEKGLFIIKWSLVFITLVFINLLWYYNFGTHGPTLYLFVLVFSYLIFMLNGRQLLIAAIILVTNVAILFYIEYNHPDIVGDYPTDHARMVDVFTGIFLYVFLMSVVMFGAKRIYIQAYRKATESDALKSSFLANMSHEIRTPLNAIVGFSNLLADEDLDEPERQNYVSIINASNESLLRLIDDILDVSLMETNQLKLVYNDCDLKKMMNELESTYQLKLEELHKPGLNVKIKKPLIPLIVRTDCERLRQVMINLLDNAIKYTEKGSVEFAYETEGKSLRFYVKDTGIGIEEKHKDHLFDRFYKVEDNTEKLFRGTGIGLYLCKKIVELLGGNIGVISQINKGSEFYFLLPAGNVISKKPQPVALPKLGESKRNKDKNKKTKVLVVEDQLSNRQYYDAILKAPEFELVHAVDGLDGLEKFKANADIDLVLMDIKMPEMNGFEALKEIRKLNATVPVFALTAYAMASDKERCKEAGFDAYLSKPLDKRSLLKKINQITEANNS